jgi:hypothetical protein
MHAQQVPGLKMAAGYALKLGVAGLAFILGVMAGGALAAGVGLAPPALPAGMDGNSAFLYLLLESPLFALALALLSRRMAGGWAARALALSVFAWISYSLNTALEAYVFTDTTLSAAAYAALAFLPGCALCAAAVAALFPPAGERVGYMEALREFFQSRTLGEWVWRLPLAALAFMPVYYFFGLLVVPFTYEVYQQGAFGLRAASLGQVLAVLSVRSLLFLLACLSVVAAWRGSARSLALRLGFSLFVLVGLLYMLAAAWMPLSVRGPHTLEILADSFVYAAALTWLLKGASPRAARMLPRAAA